MAPLLSRLFNNRKETNRTTVSHKLLQETQNWKTPAFSSQHQIRVLLFRECDWRGRKLLFDSKTVRKKDVSSKKDYFGAKTNKKCDELSDSLSYQTHTSSPLPNDKNCLKNKETSSENAISYEYLKPSPDVKMLGEMIFGSVAMSFWGSTMKIHTIRSPPQLMISFIFPTPMTSNPRLRDFDNSGSLQNSISEHLIPNVQEKLEYSSSSSMAHSVPVDVPGRFNTSSRDLSFNSDSLNSTPSNCSGTTSVMFSPDSQNSSLTRSSSYNSFQRRWLRNLNTNIECGLRRKSDELCSIDEPKIGSQRRVKLGLSIVFSLGNSPRDENAFRDFFFSHIPLIEGHATKLVETVSNAYLHKESFVHVVYEGTNTLRSAIQDLYMTPRLTSPMWLTMVAPSSNHHQQCRRFMGEFLSLIRLHDTKQTHFFVSTLLTAVLTHHLAWVSTVIPTENSPIHNLQKKEAAFWLDQLAKSHPYNPLWMQLGDLYGAVGFPCKVSQTVILGKRAETILRFLQVLSYFIRCSDVYEKIQEGGAIPDYLREPILSSESESLCSSQCVSDNGIISSDGTLNIDSASKNEQNCLCVGSNEISNNQSVMFLLGGTLLNPTPLDRVKFEPTFSDDESKKNSLEEMGNCAKGGADSLGYGSFGNTLELDLKETTLVSQDSGHWCTNHDRIQLNDFSLETVPEVKFENLDEHSSVCNTPTSKNICRLVPDDITPCALSSPLELNRTKLYIQEYRNLRFNSNNNSREGTPVLSSPFSECERVEENTVPRLKNVEENEAPEEGYQSMDDNQITNPKGIGEMVESLFTRIPPATKEFHLPRLQTKDISDAPSVCSGFGWSLIASLTDHYLSDFCLQGVLGTISEESVYEELTASVKASVLGEPISAAVCILADTDTWSVKICSSSGSLFGNKKVSACMSPLVAGICDSLLQMSQLNMSAEFCLMHLEDRLQELFFRSQSLAAILNEECDSLPTTAFEKATSLLAIDTNDLPLLISVATTHSPQLASFNR